MVDPRVLCRKYLLGEHVEFHMAAAWLLKGKRVAGWVESNCLEPKSIGRRHTAFTEEMLRRGYRHASPPTQPVVGEHQHPKAIVDCAKALAELVWRCPGCKLLQTKTKITRK